MRWRLGLFRLILALRRLKWNQKFTKNIQRSRYKEKAGRGQQAKVKELEPGTE